MRTRVLIYAGVVVSSVAAIAAVSEKVPRDLTAPKRTPAKKATKTK